MLTNTDIKKLASILATKENILSLQEDVNGLRETVQGLTTAVDKLVGAIDDLRVEYVAIKTELNRHEKWIKMIAKKAGVSLQF